MFSFITNRKIQLWSRCLRSVVFTSWNVYFSKTISLNSWSLLATNIWSIFFKCILTLSLRGVTKRKLFITITTYFQLKRRQEERKNISNEAFSLIYGLTITSNIKLKRTARNLLENISHVLSERHNCSKYITHHASW